MWTAIRTGSIVAGRYAIVEIIGRGGMAAVYRARHHGLGCDVALKILNHSGSRERFAREARNAARLNHPGCIRVSDYGQGVDGTAYIAMDLVEGPTLRQELQRGSFTVERSLWVAKELLRALIHAHECGVLHRDIKPENIMFSARGEVVLVDFGLSQVDEDAPLTALGACMGSPSYLAPERGCGQRATEQSDMYSLGVVLFEMLSGRRPFTGSTDLETAAMHIHNTAPELTDVAPHVPVALATVVHQAMAKSPGERFEVAADMLAHFEFLRLG